MADTESSYRLFGVFRFSLALLVVISHTALLAGPYLEAILKPWGLGNIAVMVFFALSGYIIAEALEVFYSRRVGGFLANRALRIVPPYIAALIVSVAIHAWLNSQGSIAFYDYDSVPDGIFSDKNLLSNVLLIGVLYGLGHVGLQPDYPFVRYVWAVRVEVHFYLVYAFLFWLGAARPDSGAWRRMVMPTAFIALSVLTVIAMVTGAKQLNYFSFAPYFMFGVSLYFVVEKRSVKARSAVLVSLALSLMHFVLYIGKGPQNLVAGPTLALATLCLVIMPLARMRVSAKIRQIDRWLGDLSYPIYLNHYAVSILALSLAPTRNVWVFLMSVVLCVGASWAVAQLTEPFSARLRNRIRGVALR